MTVVIFYENAIPHLREGTVGTSLVVQWLKLQASSAGGVGSIPGWGSKIPHAARCGQKKKNKTRELLCFYCPDSRASAQVVTSPEED